MTTKYCKSCDQTKSADINNFYRRSNRKNGFSAWCIPCTIKHNNTYRDKEKTKKYKADYYQKNKSGKELKTTLKKYGLTLETYNEMLETQNSCCAMCKLSPNSNKRLSVDHCHVSGDVRGLLCSNCNFILGLAKDSIVILKNAVAYLEQHEKTTSL